MWGEENRRDEGQVSLPFHHATSPKINGAESDTSPYSENNADISKVIVTISEPDGLYIKPGHRYDY